VCPRSTVRCIPPSIEEAQVAVIDYLLALGARRVSVERRGVRGASIDVGARNPSATQDLRCGRHYKGGFVCADPVGSRTMESSFECTACGSTLISTNEDDDVVCNVCGTLSQVRDYSSLTLEGLRALAQVPFSLYSSPSMRAMPLMRVSMRRRGAHAGE
jgi:hypothetical protein